MLFSSPPQAVIVVIRLTNYNFHFTLYQQVLQKKKKKVMIDCSLKTGKRALNIPEAIQALQISEDVSDKERNTSNGK